MSTMFSYPLTVPEGFREESTYAFVLEDGARQGDGFTPNVLMRRMRTDEPLEAFARGKARAEGAISSSTVLREGACELLAVPAVEAELALEVRGQSPARLRQWQVSARHEGYVYTAFCTTTEERWDADRPRFEALLRSWQLGAPSVA